MLLGENAAGDIGRAKGTPRAASIGGLAAGDMLVSVPEALVPCLLRRRFRGRVLWLTRCGAPSVEGGVPVNLNGSAGCCISAAGDMGLDCEDSELFRKGLLA